MPDDFGNPTPLEEALADAEVEGECICRTPWSVDAECGVHGHLLGDEVAA